MGKKNKQYVVFGLGKFGSSVAISLFKFGNDVLAIDTSEEAIKEISEYVTHAVQADGTDEDTLRSLGIRNFDVAVVAIGSNINMQSSIMIVMLLKEIGVNYVMAKAQNEIHKKVLEKIGADRVIFPEREIGNRIARNLTSDNIVDYIELSSEYSIVEIVALKDWQSKTLVELNMRAKHGINVMAIRRGGGIDISPDANEKLKEGDVLIVIGSNNDLQKISHQMEKRF